MDDNTRRVADKPEKFEACERAILLSDVALMLFGDQRPLYKHQVFLWSVCGANGGSVEPLESWQTWSRFPWTTRPALRNFFAAALRERTWKSCPEFTLISLAGEKFAAIEHEEKKRHAREMRGRKLELPTVEAVA